ncbi:C40 family peptidase [Streptomyces harbinensis]|uniref:C40 family peptidase n=1 Tax=Streptomyces harbinensis TaxID=1176198 RepID=UPI0034DF442D
MSTTSPVPDYATEFSGRTVLVTGAASGIGLATARRLAAGGADVVVADYRAEGAEEAAAAQAEAERANRSGSDGRPVLDGTGSSRGQAALSAGATKVGSPYVWGATGPNSFDCSGFTTWSFAQAGVQLPRTSQAQANAGMRVSESQLAPGDIVLFYGDLHHVGIYAGNGQVLHAPGTGKYVEYTGLHTMPFQFGVRVG